jgi:hypothetical protein
MKILETYLESGNYLKAFDLLIDKYNSLNEYEYRLFKNILLLCGIDFVNTYRDSSLQNKYNPYFIRNNRLREIQTILNTNQDVFFYIYTNINNNKYLLKIKRKYNNFFSDIVLLEINKNKKTYISKSMNKKGVYKYKSFFSTLFIEELKRISLTYLDGVLDPEKRINEDYVEYKEHYYNESKERVSIKNVSIIDNLLYKLMNNRNIIKLVEDIFQIKSECQFMQIERISYPKVYTDYKHWHIDNLDDQIKIMIPLENISKNNGPTLFKKNTMNINDFSKELLSRYNFIYRTVGIKTNSRSTAFDEKFVNSINTLNSSLTGQVGDMLIFNPFLIHSASQVKENYRRLNLVLVFNAINTNKKLLFKNIYQPYY